jgi:DNA repair protein RadC
MFEISNRELLSFLFDRKTVKILLHACNGNLHEIFAFPIESLSPEISRKEIHKMRAILELWKRATSSDDNPVIASIENILTLLTPFLIYQKQEEFKVVLLNSKNRVLHHQTVSLGSLNETLVHPRDVFRPAITFSAASIILVHNHPSGDPTPSDEDIALTKQLCVCGKILDIPVVDHIIIGFYGYTSLKKEGFI